MIYFMGSELDAIGESPDSTASLTSATSVANLTYARAGVLVDGLNVGYALAAMAEGLASCWIRANLKPANSVNLGGAATPVYIYDNTLESRLRLYCIGSNLVRWQSKVAGVWDYISDSFPMTTALEYWTFQFESGANDTIRSWVDDVLVNEVSAAGLFAELDGGIRGIGIKSSGGKAGFSEVVISDESILAWNVKTCPAVADGTDLDGTGVYSDIDEQGLSLTDAVVLETGESHSFKAAARTIATYARAIGIGGKITRQDESSPASVTPYLRVGGVKYSGDPITLEVGVNTCSYVWDMNPATATFWTLAEANDADLEWGWEAA